MYVLLIEGRRNSYSLEQCGKTLTVGELMDLLAEFDEDMPVYLSNDRGYTYGNITRSSFTGEELDEETE